MNHEVELLRWLDEKNRRSVAAWRARRIRWSPAATPDPRDEQAQRAYVRIDLRRTRLRGDRFVVIASTL